MSDLEENCGLAKFKKPQIEFANQFPWPNSFLATEEERGRKKSSNRVIFVICIHYFQSEQIVQCLE